MVRRVGPTEALTLMQTQGHVYLDVRTVSEFEAGHPAGAYNVPLVHEDGLVNAAFSSACERTFDKSRGLVVGCQAGHRSLIAAAKLLDAGHMNVVDQRAGWGGVRDPFGRVTEPGWERAGLPTATKNEPGRSWAELESSA